MGEVHGAYCSRRFRRPEHLAFQKRARRKRARFSQLRVCMRSADTPPWHGYRRIALRIHDAVPDTRDRHRFRCVRCRGHCHGLGSLPRRKFAPAS